MTIDPAFEMVTEGEAQALRIAVIYALRQGLASDTVDGVATNDSMLSVARKLGITGIDRYAV